MAVLTAAGPAEKLSLTKAAAAAWRDGRLTVVGRASPPDRPARPDRPALRPPREMVRRGRAVSVKGRVAMLHALAHIELNAIDLAWDLIARFDADDMPKPFYDDWVTVADDEARHFELLEARLADLGAGYGDLPAHDGLWQAALNTAGSLAARLAVVPMVLEARGLDVTPRTVEMLAAHGDQTSAALLQAIHDDEISHVAAGRRWFEFLCARRGVEPVAEWRLLLARHFGGLLKPPFNDESRRRAGLSPAYYRDAAEPPAG
ncbi:MAG: ferritin-like domain-containing protein [Rhodospirillaceae bacterium]